jgi:hypothetical protein
MRFCLADAIEMLPGDRERNARLADDLRHDHAFSDSLFDLASDLDVPAEVLIAELTAIVEERHGYTQLTPKVNVH